ncbi:hypothetical protein [Paraburkholderia sp. JHI869]|uniref:hypothetical protein n=1 Tax=Paraburkholderia sp. JHI869 TaxID=3112959 RepID=UPI00316DBC27
MSDEIPYLQQLHTDLATLLGEAIWAFALVERETYRYMKKLSSDTLDILMADQSIPVRIRVIKHLIERAEGTETMKQCAFKCIKRVHTLAETRNHIAHNPFSTWVDLDAEVFVSEIEKVTDNRQILSLEQLEEFARNAHTLASEMADALSDLSYRDSR